MLDLRILFDRDAQRRQRALEKIEADEAAAMMKAKEKGLSTDELQAERYHWSSEWDIVYCQYGQLITRKLLRGARRLMVPEPPRPPRGEANEYWEEAVDFSGQLLTSRGMSEVRKAIRDEKWAPYEPLFRSAAVLGAVSGLLAILGVQLT
jgi:hypothetical protein